jgi:hypothetical protein
MLVTGQILAIVRELIGSVAKSGIWKCWGKWRRGRSVDGYELLPMVPRRNSDIAGFGCGDDEYWVLSDHSNDDGIDLEAQRYLDYARGGRVWGLRDDSEYTYVDDEDDDDEWMKHAYGNDGGMV